MSLAQVIGGQRHGVFRYNGRADAERRAEEHGWRYVLLDTSQVTDRDGFMDACAEAFDLPSWFARNWDSLDECLRGLDLEEPDGVLVVWDGWDTLAENDPDCFEVAVEVFQDACVAWTDDDVPGAVLLRGLGPETDLPTL